MRPRPRNDEFVERLREFAINIYPSRKYHDYVYPQHSLLLRNRSSDQVWVHLGLIIIELDVQKQQQHQQKLTAIGMLSVAIIIIIAMNKFSSNYYFRHFCNVPVCCSMQWVVSHSAPNYRCTVSMVGLSNNNKGIIYRECVSLCCNRILRFVSIVICIWLHMICIWYYIFGLIHIYVHTKCNLLREPQQQYQSRRRRKGRVIIVNERNLMEIGSHATI